MAKEVRWEKKYHADWPLSEGMEISGEIKFDSYNNALMCIRCKHITRLDTCTNCGSDQWKSGIATSGVIGLFCVSCNKGITNWKCPECGTENPINNSTY